MTPYPPARSFRPRRRALSPTRALAYGRQLQEWSLEVKGAPLNWTELFGTLPVVLEIGFGGGEAVAAFGHGVFVFLGKGDAAEEIGADFEVLRRGGVEAEVGFVVLGAVAFEAGALEDGIDVLGEVGTCGVKGGCGEQRDEGETEHAGV